MKQHRLVAGTLAAGLVSCLLAGAAPAQTCPPECPAPGGKIKANSKSECYSEFGGVPAAENGFKVTCTDGASCDAGTTANACEFDIVVCLNNADPRFPNCTSPGIPAGGIEVKKASSDPELGALQSAIDALLPAVAGTNPCTDPVKITVPLKQKGNKLKKGKRKIKMKVNGESGKDNDKLIITCEPSSSTTTTVPGTSTTTTTLAQAADCPKNPAGGPNHLTLAVGANADLDTGVSGLAHNQGVTVGSQSFVCLEGCDLSTNSVCTGTGETNTGGKTNTINGETFGAPLPLETGGVPVCVINEYREDITLDRLDLATGELSMKVRLLSKVHQTSTTEPAPCPNCRVSGTPFIGQTGACQRGPNSGRPCTVDGLTEFGPTSKDCPPNGADNVGNLMIDLDLTSGEVRLPVDGFDGGLTCRPASQGGVGGPCHCPQQLRRNSCDNENQCSEAECPSGLEPGVDQLCCEGGGVQLGCYAGQNAAVTDIIRTGIASVAYADPPSRAGAWPEETYPKQTQEDGSLVSVFCIAATTANVVNNVAGLPGPGALILPGPMTVSRAVCVGGDNDGQPCGGDTAATDCPGGTCQ